MGLVRLLIYCDLFYRVEEESKMSLKTYEKEVEHLAVGATQKAKK